MNQHPPETILNCLVTGGAGFIGSHLVEALCQQGHHVTVFDNFSTGQRANLSAVQEAIGIVEGDLRDQALVMDVCRNKDVVFHLGAISSVTESLKNPLGVLEVNVNGTLNILAGATAAQVPKLVFVSSAAVYGSDPAQPKVETMAPSPINPYGVSKWMGEQYCKMYSELFPIQVVGFRFFNVFGPRQNPQSQYSGVISVFVDRVLQGEPLIIYGDGTQTRDFIHVQDIVQANLLALQPLTEKYNIYNVATGVSRSLLDIVDALQTITGKTIETQYQPDRRRDIRHSEGDIRSIRADLGFSPKVAFRDGLQAFVDAIACTR